MSIKKILPSDPLYPTVLHEAKVPPKPLYVRGNLPQDWQRSLSVVGARKMTHYGRAATSALVPDLTSAGVIIVSGLALGIDGHAHELALRTGITVAVLGSGVDDASIAPQTHVHLAQRILENGGAIISSYAPKTAAYKSHFPERNNIIAGLTRGTIVVEAAHQSGALITAFQALEMNRDVWAVPGPITSAMSVGSNRLLFLGALPALSSKRILKHYGWENQAPTISPIQNFLRRPQTLENIASFLQLSHADAMLFLLEQESLGRVKKLGPNHYGI